MLLEDLNIFQQNVIWMIFVGFFIAFILAFAIGKIYKYRVIGKRAIN